MQAKKLVLIDLSLFFEVDSVLIIDRDSEVLFDLTVFDIQVRDLRLYPEREKAYLVSTGYNRNMIRFSRR